MKDPWYCGVDGEQYGPYTWEQLRAMAAEGRVVSETYVRRESDQQWLSAGQVPGLLQRKKALVKAKPVASQSASIPVGRAVPPDAASLPVALAEPPAEPEPPPLSFHFSAAPATSHAALPADEPPPSEKRRSPWLLVGMLGGAVALLGLVGIGVAVWSWSRPARPTNSELALAVDEGLEGQLDEAFAQAATEMQKQLAEANPARKENAAAPASNPRSVAAAKKVIASQGKWTSLLRFSQLKINAVSLQITSVWLADEAGQRVEPVLPDAAAAPSAAPAKYVCVEVRVSNAAPVPRRYASWNGASATAAILADPEGNVLAPVPAAQTPAINRLSAVKLSPGQSILDVLVFEAPTEPFESLKLALAKSSLAEGAQGHLAIEVPLEALFRQRRSLASQPSSSSISARAVPQTGAEPQSIAEAPSDEPMPKTLRRGPPTKEELNKQFEQLDKETKTGDKGKEPSP